MNDYSDSTDRRPVEYLLFALGFAGFMLGGGGIVLLCPALALTGAILLLLAVCSFRSPPEE